MKINSYILTARIYPLLIIIIPLGLNLNFLIFNNVSFNYDYLVTNVIFVVFISLFAGITRDWGKKLQSKLFIKWNGSPAVRFLRHNNNEYNKYSRQKCHQFLKTKFSNIKMPTASFEQSNPNEADLKYQAYIDQLKAITRDNKKYNLLFIENKNYGFWRNLLSLKLFGIIISAACIIVHIIFLFLNFNIINLIFLIANSFLLFTWIFLVNEYRVKSASESYANSLLEICFSYKEIEDK